MHFVERDMRDLIACNTRIALRHPHEPRMKLQVEGGIVAQQVAKDARELRLLALDAIRMSRGVRKHAEVELRQYSVLLAAILEIRGAKSLRDQRLRGSKSIEHVEGGRVKG